MLTELPILTSLIALPLIGALLVLVLVNGNSDEGKDNARYAALWTTLITFIVSLVLWFKFDSSTDAFQFVEKVAWFKDLGISYHVGIDGISIFMVLLTTFLMPVCILCSWGAIKERVSEYMAAFLILESFVIGVFCALDTLLFYMFFEGMLIPMYLIIGIWGGDRRVYAAVKFFLYTLLGSVLFLLALLYLYFTFGTTDIPRLMELAPTLDLGIQQYLWLALFASFAVKVPMWPFHTWLPDAHVQAPTGGSVILAGVLLKMGAYGFLRFSLPMLPDASLYFADFVFVLSIIAVIYTSLIALMQEDMKKLIAYSSVAHMGFVTLGIFSFTKQGVEGAILQMISHGVVSGALFLCVGVVYDRLHTRQIDRYGGLAFNMPKYAAFFLFFTMASIGLPGTSGFVGEMLILVGTFQVSEIAAALAATGMILGAAYMLWLYRRVCYGELTKADVKKMGDLNPREFYYFLPLIIMVLWIGVYPSSFTEPMNISVNGLLESFASDAVQVAEANTVLEAQPLLTEASEKVTGGIADTEANLKETAQ